jgi:hypothetical protein
VRPLHRPHFLTTALLVGLTGTVTGLAAAGRIGPFDALGAGDQHTASAQLPLKPFRADSLFPAPTPAPVVHEQIVVADPPQPAHRPAPTSAPTPEPESPTPAPTASPTPHPCNDDDCGPGGGDG